MWFRSLVLVVFESIPMLLQPYWTGGGGAAWADSSTEGWSEALRKLWLDVCRMTIGRCMEVVVCNPDWTQTPSPVGLWSTHCWWCSWCSRGLTATMVPEGMEGASQVPSWKDSERLRKTSRIFDPWRSWQPRAGCHSSGTTIPRGKRMCVITHSKSCIYIIRPHRFGGEGVLIGGQNSNTKCSMTFVNIAVAISALAGGGPKTVSHRDQNTVVFSTFFEDFWVSERKRVLKWNFGSFW